MQGRQISVENDYWISKGPSAAYVEEGSLPLGFELKDPEGLQVNNIANLWRHIQQRQQGGQLIGFAFTREFYDGIKAGSCPNLWFF
jgi:hypothetical protein